MKANSKVNMRTKEIDLIFEKCPAKCFDNALELGAGAGIQILPLSYYCNTLTSSDIDQIRFDIEKVKAINNNIRCLILDAENISGQIPVKSMNLVFSSNLMEHLPNPEKGFKEIYFVLKDEGVSICTMPSVFMKILFMLLFYPAKFSGFFKGIKRRLISQNNSNNTNAGKANEIVHAHNNNPKWHSQKKRTFLSGLYQSPHGAYNSNLEELFAWRKTSWLRLIEGQGFKIIKIIKLPVTTGYSFKLQTLCKTFEKLGLCSSYAYVAVKDESSKYIQYWK